MHIEIDRAGRAERPAGDHERVDAVGRRDGQDGYPSVSQRRPSPQRRNRPPRLRRRNLYVPVALGRDHQAAGRARLPARSHLLNRLTGDTWLVADISSVIRLGLIGGGMPSAEARMKVRTYVESDPPLEILALAQKILIVGLNGAPDEVVGKKPAAASPEETNPSPDGKIRICRHLRQRRRSRVHAAADRSR